MTREQLDLLAKQIAELSLRIDVAKHSLLTHIRIFDAHDGWEGQGFRSTADWLAWRIDIGTVAAREHVRVAKALGELPLVDAAFAAGKLTYSKVRAITRVATPETEQGFIDVALHATASQVDKLAAAYRRVRVDPSQPAFDQQRFVRRTETPSGMVRIEIQLPPEQANIVWEAMSAALDAGRREAGDASAEAETPEGQNASAEALQTERADALVSVAQGYLQHEPRTLGSGYELVVMTTKDQLEQGPGGVGGFLRDGTPVPLHIARMLACDCTRVDVEMSGSGEILDVGRARRTIPSAIGRALWLRDGGCRVPGCGRKRHLHAHHIEGWAEGGKTAASNLVLLCPIHHSLVHEGQLHVEVYEGRIQFRNAHGLTIRPAPSRSLCNRPRR
ncbi:MAG: DUF222 domain-containing protein [Deltaproteobacteria bacterium]|nr:DUF222 domain-containing protein [Deltaproteobacteria bacterium]